MTALLSPQESSSPTDTALVIGEALVDVVHYADGKVAVHPGGSPANVALGLSRLGRHAPLLTNLGSDEYGHLVQSHLENNSVPTIPGSITSTATSVAQAHLDESGVATYDFQIEWDLSDHLALPSSPLVVHTGSIAAVLAPGGARVKEILQSYRDHATITYDPNVRPSLMGSAAECRPIIESFVRLAHVVKVSDEDLAYLYPDQDLDELANYFLGLGPQLVVITRGGAGAQAWWQRDTLAIAAPAVNVVDTVGAGDSFMSGLIYGLWELGFLGCSGTTGPSEKLTTLTAAAVHEIISRCIQIGAITVSRAGANPPNLSELATNLPRISK